jgi:uncharacterized protein involved in response to NO
MNKYQAWWDSLPKHTQEYLRAQPVWHDRDLFYAVTVGVVIGFLLGVVLTWH